MSAHRLYTAAEVTAILERLAQVERDEIATKMTRREDRDKLEAVAAAFDAYAKSWRVWMPDSLLPATV
jgi:hypothetical protein